MPDQSQNPVISAIEFFNTNDDKHLTKMSDQHGQKLQFVRVFLWEERINEAGRKEKIVSPKIYSLTQLLGGGNFGEAFRAVEVDSEHGTILENKLAAVKITKLFIRKHESPQDYTIARDEANREIKALNELKMCYGSSDMVMKKKFKEEIQPGINHEYEADTYYSLVAMPLYTGGDMRSEHHKDSYSYGSLTLVHMAYQLSQNLKVIHDKNFIHTDIKPGNIIWNRSTNHAQLIDFGCVQFLENGENYVRSSKGSDKEALAPECEQNNHYRYSKASDIYALGKVIESKYGALASKPYLSYDELLINNFIKMMKGSESQRPSASDCEVFFSTIKNKMELDQTDENSTREKLNKCLVSLEVYANNVTKESQSRNSLSIFFSAKGIIANKEKKSELAVKAIEAIMKTLSCEKPDLQLLQQNIQAFIQEDAKFANGLASKSGRLTQIMRNIVGVIQEHEAESSIPSARI